MVWRGPCRARRPRLAQRPKAAQPFNRGPGARGGRCAGGRFLMSPRLLFAVALLVVTAAASVHAVEPSERLADPALEARARTLSKELRCLVCQNQSIDESNADLAHDLR